MSVCRRYVCDTLTLSLMFLDIWNLEEVQLPDKVACIKGCSAPSKTVQLEVFESGIPRTSGNKPFIMAIVRVPPPKPFSTIPIRRPYLPGDGPLRFPPQNGPLRFPRLHNEEPEYPPLEQEPDPKPSKSQVRMVGRWGGFSCACHGYVGYVLYIYIYIHAVYI